MFHLTGKRIRSLRKQNDLTLQELAFKAGCSKSCLWELENKDGRETSAHTLYKIAISLGVTMEFLLTGEMPASEDERVDEYFLIKYKKMTKKNKDILKNIMRLIDDI